MNSPQFKNYAAVIIDLGLNKILDYGIPDDLDSDVRPERLVEVTLRGQIRRAYVLEIKTETRVPKVLPISQVLSQESLLTEDLVELAKWMSRYYFAPLGRIIRTMLPSSVIKQTQQKKLSYVKRASTRDQIVKITPDLRISSPKQAEVVDVMLKVKRHILLTELLEQAKASRSSVHSLVKKGILAIEERDISASPFVDEQYFLTKPKTQSP